MRILLAAILLGVLSVPVEAAAPAGAVSVFFEGKWTGEAFADEKTGQFTHCAASGGAQKGIELFVSVDRDYYWAVAFGSDHWKEKPDERFPVRLRFDGGAWIDFNGVMIEDGLATVVMPGDAVILGLFRQARRMDMQKGELTASFSLAGTYRVMARLLDCVDQRLALEGPGSHAAPTSGGPSGGSAAEPEIFTGTGIIVSTKGHLITNAHVVSECKDVAIRRSGDVPVPADVIVDDKTNDLALLKAEIAAEEKDIGHLTAGRSPPAGEHIAVYGFPLAGALSSTGNIVEGNITAAAGVGDDINHFQISAPIQPGNSGGPLLDFGGGIVGVVNAKLNELAWASQTGSLPQNVNFAIKGNVLANFLEAHSVPYLSEPRAADIGLVAIAERARQFTVLVVCWQ
jgi:S1-C subfamily serine protease